MKDLPQSRQTNKNNHKRISKNQKNARKSLSIKTKLTYLAVALGVIPVFTVGIISFNLLNRSLTRQIGLEQVEKTEIAARNITIFLEDRLNEIDAIAQSAIFTDAKFRDSATLQEKTAILNSLKDELEYYNSIVFFDPQGNPIFQAKSDKPNTKNYGGKKYFQQAVKTGEVTINGPGISPSSGQLRVEFAAPVKDKATGKLIGVLRFKIPGNYINALFEVYQEQDKHWSLVNAEGTIFASDLQEQLNDSLTKFLPEIAALHQAKQSAYRKTVIQNAGDRASIQQDWQFVSYVPVLPPKQFPELHIGTLLSVNEDIALAPVRQLGWTLFIGTAITAAIVAVIAATIADRLTIPLLNAVTGLKKIGRGELNTRLAVAKQDEIGELNANINLMAEQIQASLQEQQSIVQKQRQEKEQLELAIHTLLDEVSEATNGDLTVRANLDSMELSTVADLFNAIIDNLQDIAIEARNSSNQVGFSLKQNEEVILVLAENALSEAKETRDTLISVEEMSKSIKAVAANASQAEKIANDTYNTVIDSTNNMDLTVNSILALRTTVGETSKKMKRLGESSQKISQVVSFIEEIAMKTNVLSINATVEAGRAGEYGQGFTIVAEQVGALAEQSAAATKEIANIVATIQAETKEVNQAMESGTTQVVETTRIVESTKQSLGLVLEKSQEINQLMGSISHTTVSQADTSQNLTELMHKISQMSETTSKASQRVAQSIVDVAEVAAQLESTVAQFKVSESA